MKMPRILMCPPDYYGIEYEINPWMNRARQADHDVATAQWNGLYEVLQRAGAQVSLLTPEKGLPDLVFTANAGLVFRDRVILSRFRYSQRQAEEPVFAKWFQEHDYDVTPVPQDFSFEGAGDALFCGDTLWAGYRMRSDAGGHQAIGAMLRVRVIPLELVDARYYHLDTCFCPLAPDVAVYFPGAFDEYGRRALAAGVNELIAVEANEAERFACNAVVVGKTVVTNTGCDRLHEELSRRGYSPLATPLDEFVKAGGSAKCLTLRLDGEDAAAWRE
jgi:N-dimethylarginine dimethylaminohydrolase